MKALVVGQGIQVLSTNRIGRALKNFAKARWQLYWRRLQGGGWFLVSTSRMTTWCPRLSSASWASDRGWEHPGWTLTIRTRCWDLRSSVISSSWSLLWWYFITIINPRSTANAPMQQGILFAWVQSSLAHFLKTNARNCNFLWLLVPWSVFFPPLTSSSAVCRASNKGVAKFSQPRRRPLLCTRASSWLVESAN